MRIGKETLSDGFKELRVLMEETRKENPEWYNALCVYNYDQICRIMSICHQDDPRDIATQLRAEGFIRPAELIEEAMKEYPIYDNYFIN